MNGVASGLTEAARKIPVEPVSLRSIVSLLPGLLVIVALAGYSVVHALPQEGPEAVVLGRPGASITKAAAASPGVMIGNKVFYPAPPQPHRLVVHLACNQDDARLARIYDPPATGQAIILRLDQSAQEMRLLFDGKGTQFPSDTRLVTTPCMQAMIEHGEFP